MNRFVPALLVAAFLGGLAPAVSAGELRPWGYGSMTAIEASHAGSAFIVVLWATDCAPCRRELRLLEGLLERHPAVPVVLVATDDRANEAQVGEVLAQYALDSCESWQFAEANVERLRYSVDPRWYGELPRAYLYDAAGQRRAISGPLSEETLEAWVRDPT